MALYPRNPARLELSELFLHYDLDGLWVKNLATIRYLTGFSGSTAQLMVRPSGERLLLVDSRYTTQACEECKGCEVRQIAKPIDDMGAAWCECGAKRIGFEARQVTVIEHQTLKALLPEAEWVGVTENLALLRSIKSADEIAKIRATCALAHAAYEDLLAAIVPGMSEKEAAWLLDRRFRERGAKGNSFDSIVGGGPRAALVHGQPSERRFVTGDMILVDRGAILNGYVSDETTTVVLGKADDRLREIYGLVKEAHDRCIAAVKPGASCRELDAIAREVIVNGGYGEFFGHSTGHGVGLEVHEQPMISANAEGTLEEGMIFSVEPGIYLPDWGGVRIEDLVLVTATGCECLTLADKTLTELTVA